MVYINKGMMHHKCVRTQNWPSIFFVTLLPPCLKIIANPSKIHFKTEI